MIEVAAALIIQNHTVLIARRGPQVPHAGKWEFPGGKIEVGETPQECLVREIREEFDISIKIGAFFAENIHHYDSKIIHLVAYKAVWIQGRIYLKDHDQFLWTTMSELLQYDLLPADVPIAEKLMRQFNARP